MGLKFESLIYSVPVRAVPPFRVPPYRGGTAERFGRFCRCIPRNGAERCGTAERLSYPQASLAFPSVHVADNELAFMFVEVLLSLLSVFDVAAGDQGFQGGAEFVVAYLYVGGSKVLAQLVLAHLCPMCFEELAYLCHLVLPGGNVNGSAGDGDLDRAVLVGDQVCHA